MINSFRKLHCFKTFTTCSVICYHFIIAGFQAVSIKFGKYKSVKYKILCKAEKTCKYRWLIEMAKNEFNGNPYITGKSLLDPKCCCSLNVNQEILDQHKSSNLFDNNYNIPLGNLTGPSKSALLKKFSKISFSYDFFKNLMNT